ncbi:MAG TPA: hypothetical protein VH138_18030 [Vicinamibacterales bacterium]|nr:hypothetical protein [Vicinamibacterales bacterium]
MNTAVAMCASGIVVFLIGIPALRREIAKARGLDTILALTNVSVAVPLAVFGALHLFGPQFVASIVPRYMPLRMFWVNFVGGALIAASVSIATNVAVRWSGLLFGIMMFLFVAMIHLPGAIAQPHNRIIWMVVFREMSFGGAGLILAGRAKLGQVFVTAAMLLFGVEHFLHPLGLPGVPLVRQMPAWVPARQLVDYATGAALLAGVVSVAFKRNTRFVLTCAGGWLLLLVLLIYGPVLIGALSESSVAGQVERVNYFADTLLFTGAILTLARASSARG